MKGKDVDLTDSPELTPEMFAKAVVRRGLKPPVQRKVQLTVRVDSDVLEWYRGREHGCQTQTRALLRSFKEAHKSSS